VPEVGLSQLQVFSAWEKECPSSSPRGTTPGLPNTKRISVLDTDSLKQLDFERMLDASYEESD